MEQTDRGSSSKSGSKKRKRNQLHKAKPSQETADAHPTQATMPPSLSSTSSSSSNKQKRQETKTGTLDDYASFTNGGHIEKRKEFKFKPQPKIPTKPPTPQNQSIRKQKNSSGKSNPATAHGSEDKHSSKEHKVSKRPLTSAPQETKARYQDAPSSSIFSSSQKHRLSSDSDPGHVAGATSPMKKLRMDSSQKPSANKRPVAPLSRDASPSKSQFTILEDSSDSDAPLLPNLPTLGASFKKTSKVAPIQSQSSPTLHIGNNSPSPRINAASPKKSPSKPALKTSPRDRQASESEISSSDIEVSHVSTQSPKRSPPKTFPPQGNSPATGSSSPKQNINKTTTSSASRNTLEAMFLDSDDGLPQQKQSSPSGANDLANMFSDDGQDFRQNVSSDKKGKGKAKQPSAFDPIGLLPGSSSSTSDDNVPRASSNTKASAANERSLKGSKRNNTRVDSESPLPKSPKPKAKRTVVSITDSDSESSQKSTVSNHRRKGPAAATSSSSPSRQKRRLSSSQDSNSEDEDDLSMDFDTLQETRLRAPKAKPDRLATLRAARESKKERQEMLARKSHASRQVVLDSDEEAKQKQREKKQRKKENKAWRAREKELRRLTMNMDHSDDPGDDGESYSADDNEPFIVADDDDALEADELRQMLPAKFTAAAFQTDKWHFRQFIYMLVQKRLLPNEPIPDDWDLSRKKCRRLVHDLVGSLVRSQVWNKRFTDALKLPNMAERELPEVIDGCDACHLGGRKSKFSITLYGKVYDEDPPYRPVAVNKQGEPEDTDDDNTKAYKQKDFVVGRDCLRRASTYHSLMHFEWNLWRQVCEIVDTVKAEQETSDDEEEGNLTRKEWRRQQRRIIAQVKETMGKDHFESKEWKELDSMLNAAKRDYAV